ncbi:MAG: FecR domain-containing protein, partial [Candidatus Krumholzibacteria bacterium]|nr:FecR domain-containing protein [Candidatus Krumholzibacteria bacterium]
GDEVRTGNDSDAEIHFENGSWVLIGSNSSVKVKASDSDKSASGNIMDGRSFEVVQNFLKLENPEGTSSLARPRSAEKSPELRLESPCQTKVRDDRPIFRWNFPDASTELRLTLYNEEGIHWQHTVKDTMCLPYPNNAPELVPGMTYSWTLETTDPLRFPPLRSQAAFFGLLTPDEEEKLKTSLGQIVREKIPSESAYHIVRGGLFFSYDLMEEAIDETSKALETESDNATLHSILARLYAKAGRIEEALDEYNHFLKKQ